VVDETQMVLIWVGREVGTGSVGRVRLSARGSKIGCESKQKTRWRIRLGRGSEWNQVHGVTRVDLARRCGKSVRELASKEVTKVIRWQ
jgi:hypothetical protein